MGAAVTSDLSKRVFLKRASSMALVSGLVGTTTRAAHAQTPDAALADLGQDLKTRSLGQVVLPGQPDYAKIKYYNARFDCVRTKAFVRPANRDGVLEVIEWANRNKRPFAIRGGGHSFEGKSSHPDLVIDMSRMTKLEFNGGDTMAVQAGVLLGDIYRKLAAAEHVFPGGTCPTVGIVGHALGGGIGDFLPIYGYAAQSLVDVTLVTMGGSMIKVDDRDIKLLGGAPLPTGNLSAAGLMKALRGGGQGSFGVITDMTFKTHAVKDTKLASFRLDGANSVSADRTVAIIQAWQMWRKGLPPAMHGMVSAKMNLSRSGGGYGMDISGVIAVPDNQNITTADIRRTLDVLFNIPEFGSKNFAQSLNAAAIVKSFADDSETTNNPRRRMLYGSSSALTEPLKMPAIQFMVRNLPSSIFASLYTAGGVANTGPETSLNAAEFLIEWTTYSQKRDASAHRKIRSLNAQVMKLSGLPDYAVPNYPDDDARTYFKNQPELDAVRKLLDPQALSTSSLLGLRAGRTSETSCR